MKFKLLTFKNGTEIYLEINFIFARDKQIPLQINNVHDFVSEYLKDAADSICKCKSENEEKGKVVFIDEK